MEMILILIALVIAVVVSVVLLWYGSDAYSGPQFWASIIGMFFAVVSGIMAIPYVVAGSEWFGAGYKAEIINNEYGTNYTQAQVFWASDVIDTVRELDRKRVEVNGDLFRDEAEEN